MKNKNNIQWMWEHVIGIVKFALNEIRKLKNINYRNVWQIEDAFSYY